MKKKIAILGSTGTIGKNLINIIKKDKSKFKILLLSTNKNYKELLKQQRLFKVKNIIITDKKIFSFVKKLKIKNLKIFNNFDNINKIFKYKIDYTMNAISGLDGLEPTLKIIKFSKSIAIANKESLICGWNLIKNEFDLHNTQFIPVDSEHFSIWYSLDNFKKNNIEKIYLTASGGPFLNLPKNKFSKITIKDSLRHPNWQMGSKISIDSATMINKVFEIIEAKNIFKIPYNKLSIKIHRDSYLHAIIKFSNGMINIIAHDTTMKIPIFNSLYCNENIKQLKTSDINFNKLNNLNLKSVDYKKFPIDKILNLMPKKFSLFETILVVANDELVNLYLKKKITFVDIYNYLFKILLSKEMNSYKNIVPVNFSDIVNVKNIVLNKINKLVR